MSRDPKCQLCSLHKSSKNVCIWGHGDGEAFIIGEAPGQAEAKTGKPFQGDSGGVLRRILKEYDLSDAYITNVAKCRPPGNRKPEAVEMKACRPYLDEEIATRKPKAILLLGATAMKAMVGRTSITVMNGQVVEKNGQTFVCAFHPAFILRDPSKEPALRMAIGRYAAVLRGDYSQEMPEWEVVDKSTFERFLVDWKDCRKISFDVETTGLDWWAPDFKINCISFTLAFADEPDVKTWVLPLEKAPVLPTHELRQKLMRYLVRWSMFKKVVGHNAKFDNSCIMAQYSVRFKVTSDTCLAHHLIDENASHELKALAREFCNAPDYDLTKKEKTGGTTAWKLFGYNAADTHYTHQLDELFKKKLDEQEEWLYRKVIIPASRVLERAETNGMYIDVAKIDATEKEEREKLERLRDELNEMAGSVVNWNSPPQVAEVLYKRLGITATVFTDKGAPSTGEAALVDIKHPIAKKLEQYRNHEKFLSTYIGRLENGQYVGGWRSYMVGPHLHLSIKMNGTVTGRYSSRLHQVPRDGTVRNIVTAPPGWTFIQLDLSQAELRVIAIVAGEPEMLNCFKIGRDIHWRTLMDTIEMGGGEYAEEIRKTAALATKRKRVPFEEALEVVRNLTPDEAVGLWKGWKEARKKAKGINFGFPYGQSAEGFIDFAKLKYGFEPTLRESTQFREAFFHTYRFLPAWHERQKALVHADGFVRSLSGRKRRLPGIRSSDRSVVSECERQAINSPIQGFIGDYKAMIMVELDRSFRYDQLRVVGEVHDSILMWGRTKYLDDILPELKQRAENPELASECGLKFPIKMAVDIELGPWGAGRPWKP